MIFIGESVVGAGSSSIDFVEIPQTYTNLRLYISSRSSTVNGVPLYVNFNNDTSSNYRYARMYGNGFDSSASSSVSTSIPILALTPSTSGLNNSVVVTIHNYARTTVWNRTATFISCSKIGISSYNLQASQGTLSWNSTNEITSIAIKLSGDTFAAGSVATLYGF